MIREESDCRFREFERPKDYTIVFEIGREVGEKLGKLIGDGEILVDDIETIVNDGCKVIKKRRIGHLLKWTVKEYSIICVGRVLEPIARYKVVYLNGFLFRPGVALDIDDLEARERFADDWGWISGESKKEDTDKWWNPFVVQSLLARLDYLERLVSPPGAIVSGLVSEERYKEAIGDLAGNIGIIIQDIKDLRHIVDGLHVFSADSEDRVVCETEKSKRKK